MYSYLILNHFQKQLKRIARKHRSVKKKMIEALNGFRKEHAVSLGNGVYKIRIGADGIGKSGGYRLLIWIMEIEGLLIPVCIYAKNERENISLEERNDHLARIKEELRLSDY